MAKPTKKTDTNQQNHNSATRGINTKRKLILWERREVVKKSKDEGGAETIEYVDVKYPPNMMWDWTRIYDAVSNNEGVTRLMKRKSDRQKPLQAPLDSLLNNSLDEDIVGYAEEHNARVVRTPLGDGRFRFEVVTEQADFHTNKNKTVVLLTVDGARGTSVPIKRKKFSRKKR